jgi:hypothetical protein
MMWSSGTSRPATSSPPKSEWRVLRTNIQPLSSSAAVLLTVCPAASRRYSEKQVGYMACSILMNEVRAGGQTQQPFSHVSTDTSATAASMYSACAVPAKGTGRSGLGPGAPGCLTVLPLCNGCVHATCRRMSSCASPSTPSTTT